MNNYFVILAAGTGKRFSKNTLKQYQIYKNRPVIDHSIIKALKSKLFKKIIIVVKNKKNKAVIPALKSKDTLKYKVKSNYYNLDRNNSFLTQTPQGFKFNKILDLSTNNKNQVTDEATLFINQN